MNISLNSDEINKAIIAYIGSQGIDTTDKKINVLMIAGRKDNGFKAEVEILPMSKSVETQETFNTAIPVYTEDPKTAVILAEEPTIVIEEILQSKSLFS